MVEIFDRAAEIVTSCYKLVSRFCNSIRIVIIVVMGIERRVDNRDYAQRAKNERTGIIKNIRETIDSTGQLLGTYSL